MPLLSEKHDDGVMGKIQGYDLLGGKYSGESSNGKPCGRGIVHRHGTTLEGYYYNNNFQFCKCDKTDSQFFQAK